MWYNKKLFPSLKVINGKLFTDGSKGILRHYHYPLDTNLGPGVILIKIIPWICHACTKMLSLYWCSTIKEAFNHPRYCRVYHFK